MSFHGTALVVDDEAHVRKYVGLLLRSLGATKIIEAEDGVTAVTRYQADRPEVTLLDINMPIQDGVETLRQIRAHDPEAVVIMLTTSIIRQTIDECAALGATYYLRKDTPRDEALTRLRAILTNTFESETTETPDAEPT